ncbi:hypothetical protein J6590_002737 [Homalodisca vitripennis]|nr:hypothetical protein J6590_002737 [Homalodisca vitripennis]
MKSVIKRNVNIDADYSVPNICVDDLGCFCHDDLIMIQMDSKPVKDPSKWTINVPSIDPNDAKPGKVKKPK